MDSLLIIDSFEKNLVQSAFECGGVFLLVGLIGCTPFLLTSFSHSVKTIGKSFPYATHLFPSFFTICSCKNKYEIKNKKLANDDHLLVFPYNINFYAIHIRSEERCVG